MTTPFQHATKIGLASTLLVAFAAAQEPIAKPRPKPRIHKESNRLVKLLELQDKKAEATRRLLALGPVAVPELVRGLSHPRIEIVRTVAHVLRQLGSQAKAALPALQAMTKEKNKERAFVAAWALAKIHTAGRTIIADYNQKSVVEFDAKGKKLNHLQVGQVWNAQRLANGHYLVCTLDAKGVRELDAKGKVVWTTKVPKNPMDAERLANGNTLIADFAGKRVIEIDHKDKVVWQHKSQSPYDADRLANGNTLIAEYIQNRVIEVTPEGKIAWEFKDAKGVLSAERLPDGNTLMALFTGRAVVEVDSNAKEVWRVRPGFNPDCALRLPNGHTLIGGQGKLLEYDRKSKVVATIKVGRAASVDRY